MSDEVPNYIEGAKFINHTEEPPEWMYPRDLQQYEMTTKFRSRFRDLKGIISGQDVRDALEFGDMWCAARGCVTFVMEKRGTLLYVIVAADIEDHLKDGDDELIKVEEQDLTVDDFHHTAVTIWPYIKSRDAAWKQGLSYNEIELIESIEPNI